MTHKPEPCRGKAAQDEVVLSTASRRVLGNKVALLLIALVTTFAFAPVLSNDLVDWDDNYILVENDAYRGLGVDQLRWIFTTRLAGHYQPLTWLSFAVEYAIWGEVNPPGLHATNLFLHIISAVGVFYVTRRLLHAAAPGWRETQVIAGALSAGLLFAVHPLRVESVAWATERRDVLSGALVMATVLLYLRAAEAGRNTANRRVLYASSLACFVLSLMAKATGVVLPVVLLLLDAYPLRRLRGAPIPSRDSEGAVFPAYFGQRFRADAAPYALPTHAWRRVIAEKLLFAVPAALAAAIAIWAQAGSGALRDLAEHPAALRIAQAFYGLFFYVWKTVCPTGLIPLYEQDPDARTFDSQNVFAALLVLAAVAFVWTERRRLPSLMVATGVYVLFLVSVLGVAQSGPQLVADRYSYLSCIPWAVLLGGLASRWWRADGRGARLQRATLLIGVSIVVGALSVLTRAQTRIWSDSETLWRTVIGNDPGSGIAHANLAVLLNERQDHNGARAHALEALSILPGNRVAHVELAHSAANSDDLATAEKHLEIALEIRPDDPAVMLSLAEVMTRRGQVDQAERIHQRLYTMQPDVPAWQINLAGLLASQGRYAESRRFLERALELDPDHAEARFRLAVVLLELNEPAEAIATLEDAIRRHPDDARIMAKLAWVLATCSVDELRDGNRALRLAWAAGERKGDTATGPQTCEALAAALAESGDYAVAVATAKRCLTELSEFLPETAIRRIEAQVKVYEAGRPYRE